LESKPSEFTNTLRFTSCMAENMDSVFRRITTYIGARLRIPTKSINHIPWQEREKLFDAREIQVCWICGIYFSDIVVRADSRFQSFADLRGPLGFTMSRGRNQGSTLSDII